MIARVGWTGARPRAVHLTGLVLLAALARAAAAPAGEGVATAVFAAALVLCALVPSPGGEAPALGRAWGVRRSVLGGLAVAALLSAPGLVGGHALRPLAEFWGWAAVTALVATLEELAIRGAVQRAWTVQAGPLAGILAGAAVFAGVHLPRYGLSALPLDFAVGMALGALRAVAGRVLPCAVAHVAADWAAWWLA